MGRGSRIVRGADQYHYQWQGTTRCITRSGRLPTLTKIVFAVFSMFAVMGLLVQSATAQQRAPVSGTDPELVERLLSRIEELEGRLETLEDRQTTRPVVAAEVADVEHTSESHAAESGFFSDFPTLQIRAFADVQYHLQDGNADKNAFMLGQLDLFLNSSLTDELSVLSELVLESEEDNSVVFELERLMLNYTQSEYLTIGLGRYHSSIGYYNTAYHHGTWFQTATGRPFIFNFEDDGGLLPIHNVGLTLKGKIPSGSLGLQYVAEVGNGRPYGPDTEPVNNVTDDNSNKSFNLGLFARPSWLPGLQSGFSVYRDHLTPKGLSPISQTIFAGHLVYVTPTFEWLSEGVLIRHDPRGTDGPFHTTGFYAQISQQFDKWRPYMRYQYVNAPAGDPLFGQEVGRRHGPSLGLRYDFSDFVALKVQYDYTLRRQRRALTDLTLQASFAF